MSRILFGDREGSYTISLINLETEDDADEHFGALCHVFCVLCQRSRCSIADFSKLAQTNLVVLPVVKQVKVFHKVGMWNTNQTWLLSGSLPCARSVWYCPLLACIPFSSVLYFVVSQCAVLLLRAALCRVAVCCSLCALGLCPRSLTADCS